MRITQLLATLSLVVFHSALALGQAAVPKPVPKPDRSFPEGPFIARPYLQLGSAQAEGTLLLAWHATDIDADWQVDLKTASGDWHVVKTPEFRRVAVKGVDPHRVYRASLKTDGPGQVFSYRVRNGADVVFEAEGLSPKSAAQTKQRFVVFGDGGADTPEERQIAYQTFLQKPDFVMITGDIVYGKGLLTEYLDKFWPIYNSDKAAADLGAPLMRSTLFLGAPGNHDIASRNLDKDPDGLAYFYYWFQPLNGPNGSEGGPLVAPVVGSEPNRKAFFTAAGDSFPRMANFSYDYGNSHWTVLDANATVDWTNRELQAWVANDLEKAKNATWRFVSFHQPGFNSSRKHFDEQYMRILAPVFEAGKVDIVFNGHVHNYQRSYPLRFVPSDANGASPRFGADGKPGKGRLVDGHLTLDKTFDGQTDTSPEGVIYLVTGAGGQHLYNPEQQDDPASWQAFTLNHISKIHSLTVADIDGSTLNIRQLSPTGEEVDRFTIKK